MPRLMSVSLTEEAVVERRKTVTRRTGWRFLKPGDRLTLCRKVMGRRTTCIRCGGAGEVAAPHVRGDGFSLKWLDCERCRAMGKVTDPLVRLAEVEVVDVRSEQLREIHMRPADVEAEGFPGWTPRQFIDFFCEHMGGTPDQEVTRIEWRYLDPERAVQA